MAYRKMIDHKRDLMDSEGGRLVKILRANAPKKTGEFAKSIHHRVYTVQAGAAFSIEMDSPLGTFITKGTKPHPIAARNAGALRFFWPLVGMVTMVPKGGGFRTHTAGGILWIGKGYVNHPGTRPNDFINRSVSVWKPGARQVLHFMAEGYSQAFSNG